MYPGNSKTADGKGGIAVKKKLLIYAAVGFLFGMAAMFLVSSLLNHTPLGSRIYSDRLLAAVGSPEAATALSLGVMGLFGSLCICGTLFYEIESWSLTKATAAHYLSMSLGYLIPNWVLCWDIPLKMFLIIEGFMTLGFFLIWLAMYLYFKRKVKKLNSMLLRKKEAEGSERKPDRPEETEGTP